MSNFSNINCISKVAMSKSDYINIGFSIIRLLVKSVTVYCGISPGGLSAYLPRGINFAWKIRGGIILEIRRFPKDPNLTWSPCRTIIVSYHSPLSIITVKGRRNHPGASSLRLASRLGDESTRDTAAGWPDLINRSHALPADKWWAGG